MSLESIGEALVSRNDIAYDKVDCVPKKVSPASLSFEKPSESGERKGQRYYEQEYSGPVLAPPGEDGDPALTPIRF
jgi:hypothetical protein